MMRKLALFGLGIYLFVLHISLLGIYGDSFQPFVEGAIASSAIASVWILLLAGTQILEK